MFSSMIEFGCAGIRVTSSECVSSIDVVYVPSTSGLTDLHVLFLDT